MNFVNFFGWVILNLVEHVWCRALGCDFIAKATVLFSVDY